MDVDINPDIKFEIISKSVEFNTQLSELGMYLIEFNKKYNISDEKVISIPRDRESDDQVFMSKVELKSIILLDSEK